MTDVVEPGKVRVRLDLSYDGKDFSGWARQRGRRTVQEELEDALRVVMRLSQDPTRPVELTVAGRTDAGVHARGQVAHVDLPEEIWAEHGDQLLRRLAGRLPMDVRVWRVERRPGALQRALLGDLAALLVPRERPSRRCRPAAARSCAVAQLAARPRRDERRGRSTPGRARLRRLLQEAGGRDHDPYAPAAALGAARGRCAGGDGEGGRLLPQHGAFAGRRDALRRRRAPAAGVAGRGAGSGRSGTPRCTSYGRTG